MRYDLGEINVTLAGPISMKFHIKQKKKIKKNPEVYAPVWIPNPGTALVALLSTTLKSANANVVI